MAINIPLILSRAFSDRQWAFEGDDPSDYLKFKCLDTLPKPTLEELIAAEPRVSAEIQAEKAEEQEIKDNLANTLKNWAIVEKEIKAVTDFEGVKAVLLKYFKIDYQHIKKKKD